MPQNSCMAKCMVFMFELYMPKTRSFIYVFNILDMKNLFTLLCLVVMAGMISVVSAGTPVKTSELPADAQGFIRTYYPDAKIVRAERDTDDGLTEYDVRLSCGTEIEFDATGAWTDVDAGRGNAVPEGIIPQTIRTYLKETHSAAKVTEVSRKAGGIYEIELSNGQELRLRH